ncbi:transposase [Desulfolithobacter dissulfuricans]|uniref:transposase n=1 Tax=Desulfolithobacter dissulfuricans TaxID=2795293 RepID=UPI00338D5909
MLPRVETLPFLPVFISGCSLSVTSEGFQSERSIAWHCADRMSLKEFLGCQLHEKTPDHSSFTVWRKRLPLDLYRSFSASLAWCTGMALSKCMPQEWIHQPSKPMRLCAAKTAMLPTGNTSRS